MLSRREQLTTKEKDDARDLLDAKVPPDEDVLPGGRYRHIPPTTDDGGNTFYAQDEGIKDGTPFKVRHAWRSDESGNLWFYREGPDFIGENGWHKAREE